MHSGCTGRFDGRLDCRRRCGQAAVVLAISLAFGVNRVLIEQGWPCCALLKFHNAKKGGQKIERWNERAERREQAKKERLERGNGNKREMDAKWTQKQGLCVLDSITET